EPLEKQSRFLSSFLSFFLRFALFFPENIFSAHHLRLCLGVSTTTTNSRRRNPCSHGGERRLRTSVLPPRALLRTCGRSRHTSAGARLQCRPNLQRCGQ